MSARLYANASEGPIFRISKARPLLTIEINERVIAGIEKDPGNLHVMKRQILQKIDKFLAKHVSWIN